MNCLLTAWSILNAFFSIAKINLHILNNSSLLDLLLQIFHTNTLLIVPFPWQRYGFGQLYLPHWPIPLLGPPHTSLKVEGLGQQDISNDKALIAQAWIQLPFPGSHGKVGLENQSTRLSSHLHTQAVSCVPALLSHRYNTDILNVKSNCSCLQESVPFLF